MWLTGDSVASSPWGGGRKEQLEVLYKTTTLPPNIIYLFPYWRVDALLHRFLFCILFDNFSLETCSRKSQRCLRHLTML